LVFSNNQKKRSQSASDDNRKGKVTKLSTQYERTDPIETINQNNRFGENFAESSSKSIEKPPPPHNLPPERRPTKEVEERRGILIYAPIQIECIYTLLCII